MVHMHKLIISFTIIVMLGGCGSQSSKQALTEDERNIADALILVTYNMLDMEGSGDYPIVSLFEGATIEVSYVQGYIMRGHCTAYDKKRLESIPKWITCFLSSPEPAWDGTIYFAFDIGKKEDGTYYSHTFGFFPVWDSLEVFFEGRHEYQPLEDYLHTFELYIPPR